MKFARELEEDLVPEWRAKYLDYKVGKKKVKAVARALRTVNQTPRTPGRRKPANLFSSPTYKLPFPNRSPFDGSILDRWKSRDAERTPLQPGDSKSRNWKATSGSSQNQSDSSGTGESPWNYHRGSPNSQPERQLLQDYDDDPDSPWDSGTVTNYGSIIASPPARPYPVGPPSLELPDPALSPNAESFPRHNRAWRHSRLANNGALPIRRTASTAGDAYEVGRTHTPSKLNVTLLPKQRKAFRPRRTISTPDVGNSPARPTFLNRVFSLAGADSPQSPDVPLEAYKEFDLRQAEFFNFLDKELEKVESFYKMKEGEASERLDALRQQLHVMRDRRVEEVQLAQLTKERARQEQERQEAKDRQHGIDITHNTTIASGLKWMKPIEHAIGVGPYRFGKNTKALEQLGSPSGPTPQNPAEHHRADSWRDFTRRPAYHDDVPYRLAKRKLKVALQEFYRGLELLKSYALLNRTAFRKINKKYDKAVSARPTGRYMAEKVNKAWFVQSEVLDGHIVAVEDLYARYFERGNHKIAVGKLRSKHTRDSDFSGSVFRNGLLIAAGIVFGVQGVVNGSEYLSSPDPVERVNASYLLQIYAGYFLSLFLFFLFCFDCRLWAKAKINYVFVFEFDTRHNLDWRQLSELPCLLLFLEGLFIWLNFQRTEPAALFLYWPVILVGLSTIILFFPGPILYHRSREWWAYSNFRLLLAGLYPVEFRDFFLGDMYCSLTYALGNIELFFCLYAQSWNDPEQCNSSHSRLQGFLTTLPGIWRALQCLRRYYDTRNSFPHLVNCGKYMFTILYYMSLSLYRIDRLVQLKAFFIICATVNAIYCSVWDVAMDWSLGNPYAKNPFLRDVLGYKRPWVYYLAIILDPILRFNWIFYAIYASELQHSASLSFFVGFSEICRRGMWTLFRVENEHCTNVGRFRASRDVPLPYDMPSPTTSSIEHLQTHDGAQGEPLSPEQRRHALVDDAARPHTASGADLESAIVGGKTPVSGSLRRRRLPSGPVTPVQRGIARVGTAMAEAHMQDFERKRRPGLTEHDGKTVEVHDANGGSSDEDEEEDQENEQAIMEADQILQKHRSSTVEF